MTPEEITEIFTDRPRTAGIPRLLFELACFVGWAAYGYVAVRSAF